MKRKTAIRGRRKRRENKSPPRWLDSAFWGLAVIALVVGGIPALTNLPALSRVFVPQSWMTAQASVASPSSVSLPVTIAPTASSYAPRVLRAGQGFPVWLKDRIAVARTRAMHAAVPEPAHAAPAIAIVIDDLGADVAETRRAIALPSQVSLSFLPYPETAPALAGEASRAGHQILVHVPMEPVGTADPGPMALRASLDSAQNLERLNWDLARIPGFAGINNHEGSRFTADAAALTPVIAQLAQRHVFFLDSRTTPDTVVVPLARSAGVESAARDVFLDDDQSESAIRAQLTRTESLARLHGVAIAIGHPHPATMAVLAQWTAAVQGTGIRLVTAAEAIRLKTDHYIPADSLSAAR